MYLFTLLAAVLLQGCEGLRVLHSNDGPDFTAGNLYSTASVTIKATDVFGDPLNGVVVVWSVEEALNESPAMMPGWERKKTGLIWGKKPLSGIRIHPQGYELLQQERILLANTSTTSTDGESSIYLTDIVGERAITLQARAFINGRIYNAMRTVHFGRGPLSVFTHPQGNGPGLTWDEAYELCNGAAYTGDHATGWASGADEFSGAYVGGGKLPVVAEYQAVSLVNTSGIDPADDDSLTFFPPNPKTQGAAAAAGWPADSYWTGEVLGVVWNGPVCGVKGSSDFASMIFVPYLQTSTCAVAPVVDYGNPVACRR